MLVWLNLAQICFGTGSFISTSSPTLQLPLGFDENNKRFCISSFISISPSVIDAFNFKVLESEQLAATQFECWPLSLSRKYAITDLSTRPRPDPSHIDIPTLTIDNTGIYLSSTTMPDNTADDNDVPLRRQFIESAKCVDFSLFCHIIVSKQPVMLGKLADNDDIPLPSTAGCHLENHLMPESRPQTAKTKSAAKTPHQWSPNILLALLSDWSFQETIDICRCSVSAHNLFRRQTQLKN